MKLNRTFYRVALIVIFLIANMFILRGIGSLIAFVKSGADREQMMAKVLKVNDYYKPVFTWNNLENPGREFIAKNQGEVQRDYTDSWYVKHLNQAVNTTKGIADFYTDSSRVNLFRNIEFNKKNNIEVHGTTLSHNIDMNFFSADGKLVAFDDSNVQEVYRIFKNDSLVAQQEIVSNYKIVMLLEDGFWRIRHMVRTNAEDTITIKKDAEAEGFVKQIGKELRLNGEPFYIRGINYYPKETPWAMFGDKFNDTIIDQDFRKIDSLGFNTARIFVNFEEFGKEEVDDERVLQLRRTLDLAQKHNLKVIVTLFDFFGRYDIINWTVSEQHLKGVVAPFKKHPAILAWDVKNEADLDMQVHSEGQVTSWLDFVLKRVKYYDPNHLSTIGWLHPHPHFSKKSTSDIFTFHYYEALDDFDKAYDEWTSFSEKPVIVGEFGIHSWKKAFLGNSQEDQFEHYQTMMTKIENGEKHFIAWTLYDFPELPKEIFGIFPWITLPQKNMGLLDVDGCPKEVMKVFEDLGISPNLNFEPPAIDEFKSVPTESNQMAIDLVTSDENVEQEIGSTVVQVDSIVEIENEETDIIERDKQELPTLIEGCIDEWQTGYYLVMGAYGQKVNADSEITRFSNKGLVVNCYYDANKNMYYVVVGPFTEKTKALESRKVIKTKGVASWVLKK